MSPSKREGTSADRLFTAFSTLVAKWTGSHWAFSVVAVLVVVSLVTLGVEVTNIAISTGTLLMVFVLQNTVNRDSAALHLKLDEIVHTQPDARDHVRGVEVKSEAEINELGLEDAASLTSASGESGQSKRPSSSRQWDAAIEGRRESADLAAQQARLGGEPLR